MTATVEASVGARELREEIIREQVDAILSGFSFSTLRNSENLKARLYLCARGVADRITEALSPISPNSGEVAIPADLDQANRDCLAKRKPGEPIFVILGRDPDGANIVRLWAERRASAGDDGEHTGPVFGIADKMDAWRAAGNVSASAPPPEAYASLTPSRGDLREALEPFARAADRAHEGTEDDRLLDVFTVGSQLTVGDLRRAAKVYDSLREGGPSRG